MSKYIASTDLTPDGRLKRMMAHVLDGAFIFQTSSDPSKPSFVLNHWVAKDMDEIVDRIFDYVKQRDHQILSQIMSRMDNNFGGNDATGQPKDNSEGK